MNIRILMPMILAAALFATNAVRAFAQDAVPAIQPAPTAVDPGSQTNQGADPGSAASPTGGDSSSSDVPAGPVRLARFSLVTGDVSWRPNSTDEWSTAGVNVPLREGAQLWVSNGGRAEVQFDDGSYVRLGDGAVVTLQTLYSDPDGEFTELRLNQGLLTLDLTNASSIYQIDTPITSVKAAGPAKVRVGVNDGVEIAVRDGKAAITGPGGDAKLITGNYVYLADSNSQISIAPVPAEDSWDHWNDRREEALSDDETDSHVPPDEAVVAGDLDTYGIWREDPEYGWVWVPSEPSPVWRPYEYGSWAFFQPFGWTWVSSEPWGWAPYHYGAWFHAGYGWAWAPGPARQYWCPAVVSFSYYNGNVGWCPLAPREVNYTSLSFAFGNGGLFLGFSIGEAGCYYPGPGGFCVGRPFDNLSVNRFGRTGFGFAGSRVEHNPYIGDGRFIPANARAGGLMTATTGEFGGSGKYVPGSKDGSAYFTRGQVVAAPTGSVSPFSGPVDAHVQEASWTPSRTIRSDAPASEILNRSVIRAPLPANVAQRIAPTDRPAIAALPQGGTDRTSNPELSSAAERALQARQNLGYVPPRTRTDDSAGAGAGSLGGGSFDNRAASISESNNQSYSSLSRVHDWSSQGAFHIDERNSGGGYARSDNSDNSSRSDNRSFSNGNDDSTQSNESQGGGGNRSGGNGGGNRGSGAFGGVNGGGGNGGGFGGNRQGR